MKWIIMPSINFKGNSYTPGENNKVIYFLSCLWEKKKGIYLGHLFFKIFSTVKFSVFGD